MKTIRGKDVSLTVAFRLPWPVYRRACELAQAERVKLSEILRRATERGLALAAEGGKAWQAR